jgi:xanthine dehydrogenase accessory factor
MNHSLAARAEELVRRRVPFVHARVVLAERPTSAHSGDEAIVLADGTMDGFVGGDCAESTVRAQALAVLDSGESVVLRISPQPEEQVPGKLMAYNPCLSGGTLEIFLEPHRPAPRVGVFGASPIARALIGVGAALGYEMLDVDVVPTGATAVIVASHGRDEAAVLTAAVQAGVEYVGLVASPKRGAAVVAALDLEETQRASIVTPAGLDIGAITPEEVALSILADIVARRPRPSARPVGVDASAQPAESPVHETGTPDRAGEPAIDPVCGMSVAAVDASLHFDHDGRRYFFCGSGCVRAFASEPDRYLRSDDQRAHT